MKRLLFLFLLLSTFALGQVLPPPTPPLVSCPANQSVNSVGPSRAQVNCSTVVTSVSAGGGIALTPNPITTTGSVAIGTDASLPGNPTTTTQSAGDNSTKVATTSFVTTAVNNAIAAVNPAVAVQAATTQASDTSGLTYTYVAGIGDTMTGTVNTALTVDGYTFTATGQRLLIKNDTVTTGCNAANAGCRNGVYYVTQIQTALLPPILTRVLDFDQPSDINNTGAIPVVNGTANAQTQWVVTSTVNTVGSDAITFTQFSLNPTKIVTAASTLTSNAPVIGDGSRGVSAATRSGNTTTFATTSGSLPSGDLAKFDASGNIIDNGTATVPQGGTGVITLTGLALGNGTSAFSAYAGSSCAANQFASSISASGVVTCSTPSAASAGITSGLDRNRPAASGNNIYFATDTFQQYASDGTKWYVMGKGSDTVTIGPFGDSDYLQSATNAAGMPTLGTNRTIAIGFFVVSLPGTGGGIITGCGSGNITSGWSFGNSAVNSNKLRFFIKITGSSATVEINRTLTTGFHVFVGNNDGAGTMRYTFDGDAVSTVSFSSSYVVPDSNSTWVVGRYYGGTGSSASWARWGFTQEYTALLSDANMQTIASNGANFIPGVIGTAPAFDSQARWINDSIILAGNGEYAFYGSAATASSYYTIRGTGLINKNNQ